MPEPQSQIRTTGITHDGKPVLIDHITEANMDMPKVSEVLEFIPESMAKYVPPVPKNYQVDIESQMHEGGYREVDYQDLLQVNLELLSILKRMNVLREDIKAAERSVIKTKIDYDQTLRREIVRIGGATEKMRQAWAEIQCEDLYKRHQIATQVMRELQQFSKDLRVELDTLKEISNNLRRQLDIESRLGT